MTSYAAFDRGGYPGPQVLALLHSLTNLRIAGLYLDARGHDEKPPPDPNW